MRGFTAACLAIVALTTGANATPTQERHHAEQRAVASPCAAMASARASDVYVPAKAAYQCVSEVPVQKEFSIQLIKSLKAWLEIHSTIDYLEYPAPGWLWSPVDYHKELDRILDSVNKNMYYSQYDIEVDIDSLLIYSRDFHAVFRGGLSGTVYYDRDVDLVSVSSDGINDPELYVSTDYVTSGSNNVVVLTKAQRISPVDTINGISAQQFLQTQMLITYSHDPDSMYNQAVQSLAQTQNVQGPSETSFKSPKFYPGESTIIKFKNGTTITKPTYAYSTCNLGKIVTGEEYWDACVDIVKGANKIKRDYFEEKSRISNPSRLERRQHTKRAQIPNYPTPVAAGNDNILSGYYLSATNSTSAKDVAVLVIRGFAGKPGASPGTFLTSFQSTLESFLSAATKAGKTKLIIDVQGNGGGYIDLGTELLAQLFPLSPPDQKNDMRESVGYNLILDKVGKLLDAVEDDNYPNVTTDLIREIQYTPFAWQSVMKQDASPFQSFKDFFGPNMHGHGTFTSFFQSNYSNTDPSDFSQELISITGFGPERPVAKNTPPPFKPENIVILSDGFCGSTCSNVYEQLTNLHQIPSIVIGGRPGTGPVQTVGNSKGSQVFQEAAMSEIMTYWLETRDIAIDKKQVAGTVFEGWDGFAKNNGLLAINAKNNYRLGDESSTPLQFVYGAADCRFWNTANMLSDPTAIWARVAEIAFDPSRKTPGAAGGPYTSKWCVKGSTGHSTSVTGGLKKGSLGEQAALPANAKPSYPVGWLLNGNQIVQQFSLARVNGNDAGTSNDQDKTKTKGDGDVGEDLGEGGIVDGVLSQKEITNRLSTLADACTGYAGDKWLMSLVCGALGS